MKNKIAVIAFTIILLSLFTSCNKNNSQASAPVAGTAQSSEATTVQTQAEVESTVLQTAVSGNYAKILNGDFSDFAGIWVNGRSEIIRIRQDGTLGDRQEAGSGSFDENRFYHWFSNPIDEEWSYSISLYPAGLEFNHYSGRVRTDTAKDRIYIEAGMTERVVSSDDVYIRQSGTIAASADFVIEGTTLIKYAGGNTSVTIPNGITHIGGRAFMKQLSENSYSGMGITSVTIPNSVVRIGDSAFSLNSISDVTIPNSVVYIDTHAFAGNAITSLTIGRGVTLIGPGAFSDNRLTSLVIPNNVITIGPSAFWDNQLTSLDLGNGVTSIGSEAFRGNGLENITIPNSVKQVGSYVFLYNPMSGNIVIPSSLVDIGTDAFVGMPDWGMMDQ